MFQIPKQCNVPLQRYKQRFKFYTKLWPKISPHYWLRVPLRHLTCIYRISRSFYSILFYPITLEGRRGTTDEFATIPFHLDLFSAALVELAKSIPVHSLILSSHLFFCLPFLHFPFTVPCRIVFAKPEDLETWPNHLSFRFLTRVRSSSYSPMAAWIFLRTSSLVTWSLYEMFSNISSQKPAFFPLTLQSRSMIHRHTEIWKWQVSASASPLIQEICCYLSKLASAL